MFFQRTCQIITFLAILSTAIICCTGCGGASEEDIQMEKEIAARKKCGVSVEYIGPIPAECYEGN